MIRKLRNCCLTAVAALAVTAATPQQADAQLIPWMMDGIFGTGYYNDYGPYSGTYGSYYGSSYGYGGYGSYYGPTYDSWSASYPAYAYGADYGYAGSSYYGYGGSSCCDSCCSPCGSCCSGGSCAGGQCSGGSCSDCASGSSQDFSSPIPPGGGSVPLDSGPPKTFGEEPAPVEDPDYNDSPDDFSADDSTPGFTPRTNPMEEEIDTFKLIPRREHAPTDLDRESKSVGPDVATIDLDDKITWRAPSQNTRVSVREKIQTRKLVRLQKSEKNPRTSVVHDLKLARE